MTKVPRMEGEEIARDYAYSGASEVVRFDDARYTPAGCRCFGVILLSEVIPRCFLVLSESCIIFRKTEGK